MRGPAAIRIGTRLVRQACWHGDVCAWDTERGTTGGELYDGIGGIALFLAELAARTGDAEIARAAGGAVRHALAWAAGGPLRAGFHTGETGVAWAAARAAGLLGREELAAPARPQSGPDPARRIIIEGAPHGTVRHSGFCATEKSTVCHGRPAPSRYGCGRFAGARS